MNELTRNEINEIFYKLKLPTENLKTENFEVWEVPPIKKNVHYYTSSE